MANYCILWCRPVIMLSFCERLVNILHHFRKTFNRNPDDRIFLRLANTNKSWYHKPLFVFYFRFVLIMFSSSTTARLLLLFLDLTSVEADIFLVESQAEHEGSVTIIGGNKTCRTVIEAALRCERTHDCRGMWFDENVIGDNCQIAKCPTSPGTMNHVSGQPGFFFLFTGTFETGNSMTSVVLIYTWQFPHCEIAVNCN